MIRTLTLLSVLFLCSCSSVDIEKVPGVAGAVYKVGKNAEGCDVYVRRVTIEGDYVFLYCDEAGNIIAGTTLNTCDGAGKKALDATDELLNSF